MTVLLERRLPVALLPLGSLLLLLLGLRGQHELLRYLLLRDELRDGTRLPVLFFFYLRGKDTERETEKKRISVFKERRRKKNHGGCGVGGGDDDTWLHASCLAIIKSQ